MKRWIFYFLTVLLALNLCACAWNFRREPADTASSDKSAEAAETPVETAESATVDAPVTTEAPAAISAPVSTDVSETAETFVTTSDSMPGESVETTAATVSSVTAEISDAPAATESVTSVSTPVAIDPPAEIVSGWPLMWKVTDTESHALYLFGTIHTGDERNETVLERVSPLLEKCDALAVEFDVVAYNKDTLRVLNDLIQYELTDRSTITDHMPEELYRRTVELLNQAGLYLSLFDHYNMAWWEQMVETAMLTVYTDLDAEKAMDSFLILRAYEKGLPVLEVESSNFQTALINSFDDELYQLLIEEALDHAETYNSELIELYELWLSGDQASFWKLLATEIDDDEDDGRYTEKQLALIEDYNRRMQDDRNLGMRDRVIEYLTSGKTVFFAVGSAHMANEAGLVRLLIDAGYAVEAFAY